MNHSEVLRDLLHVLVVEQGVEAGLVWKGANRGHDDNVRVQELKTVSSHPGHCASMRLFLADSRLRPMSW